MTAVRVSCLMPTRARHELLPTAVANFLAQEFADAELLIVSEDGVPDSIAPALASGRVRHIPCPPSLSLGAKRNFACQAAQGELLAHWDDDDWYARDRLGRQVQALLAKPGKALCGSSRVYFRDLSGERAWEYRYQGNRQPWLCGATLLYRREFWLAHPFPDRSIGEDNHFVWSADAAEVIDLADSALCIASVHAGNSSRKDTTSAWWTPVPRARIDALIAQAAATPTSARIDRPRATLVLAGGIGDVLRWASLVPVLDAAGYAVDLLLAADYPDCAALFAGARGVDRVLPADRARAQYLPAGEAPPELAVFAYWATPFAAHLPAARQLLADPRRWREHGDPACAAAIARELGWTGPLPVPPLAPALHAGGDEIEAGTLAVHAGCKSGWPWKKWHGYGELAKHFACVLRVGTAADEDTADTYFATPIRWPAHVRDATSPRPLADSARLIAQCAALVANDSGLMHLAAALGVPTLGIFGLTSPAREAMPWPAMHSLSGGLACEPACRTEPWGRRDCRQHLECLKQIEPRQVAQRLLEIAPALGQTAAPSAHAEPLLTPPKPPPPAPLPLAIRLGGGFGDLLLAGRIVELLWQLSGYGHVSTYSDRPELAQQALGGRGLIKVSHSLREWPKAIGVRVEITQFVRFFDQPERWRNTHPALTELIARSHERIASVRGLVDRHPHLDGFWARLNQAGGRRRGESLAWSAGFDCQTPGPLAWRATHEAALCLALDEADVGPLRHLSAAGNPWITVHDGFDTSAQVRPGQAVKCWPLAHWSELVRALKAVRPELRIVQIGGSSSRPIPGVDQCLIGGIRLGEALWLVQGAELHIDGESGLVHAAYALGTPSVVLFGPTDPAFFAYAGNTNLDAGVCTPCWWSTPDWMARCPRGLSEPACMAAITPISVRDAALRLLERCEGELARIPSLTLRPTASAVWAPPTPRATALLAALSGHAQLVDERDGHARSRHTGCHVHATKRWEYAFAVTALGIGEADVGDRPLRIADLGCGRGALGPWLASQGHAVVGYDRDFAWDGNGEAARHFLHWAADQGFAARPATLYSLPTASGDSAEGFDVVMMISVLQHLAQPALALREALRILKPGGRLVLSFDLACVPEALEDRHHRRSIVSPSRLATWLGLPESSLGLSASAIERSADDLQAAGVAGMPRGLTVGGLCLVKVV